MSLRPEVTWSIMHPVKPDTGYMRDVIAHAAQYRVDSFEICGEVHSSHGGLDGAIQFRDYPAAAAAIDSAVVAQNAALLREIVALAHDSGRPVYYWHREVMVPRAVVAAIPGLLDENGEFDLLGDAYRALVRAKLREFFERVPEMDGLVLTLTEADYSVIHNSDPQRYPAVEVVRNLVETFARELRIRGKRFVLRSFGSIAQDYEDILAGAAKVPAELPFEVETKITPYDFSPFLAFNPYLRRVGGSTVSAEYDSIGEFLGAGFLPAADPARVIASVRFAQAQGASRHVIRVDRIGHPTFGSTQAINLLAFDRAIHDPKVTADDVWAEWAAAKWPGCATEMTALMHRGIEMVKQTHFIDGHVIFHAFPIQPELKWIKACGILGVFRPGVSLTTQQGLWGILTGRTTPTRGEILREKDDAVALADRGLAELQRLRAALPEVEFRVAETAWRNATIVARAIRHWCRAVGAYFEDMERKRRGRPAFEAMIMAANAELSSLVKPTEARAARTSTEHEYGADETANAEVTSAYVAPILAHLVALREEFDAEFALRARWTARPEVVDVILPGAISDDIRVQRFMHASHARLVEGRPARFAGNRVFPNGFIECALKVPPRMPIALVIEGDAGPRRQFRLAVNGENRIAEFAPDGVFRCELPASTADGGRTRVHVRIQKHGTEYPAIFSVAAVVAHASHR